MPQLYQNMNGAILKQEQTVNFLCFMTILNYRLVVSNDSAQWALWV